MKIASGIFILLGLLGILHQKFFTLGGWWSWQQFLHHESLIAICFTAGLTLLIVSLIRRRK